MATSASYDSGQIEELPNPFVSCPSGPAQNKKECSRGSHDFLGDKNFLSH